MLYAPKAAAICWKVASLGSSSTSLYSSALDCRVSISWPHGISCTSARDSPMPRPALSMAVNGSLFLLPFAGFSGGSGSGAKQPPLEFLAYDAADLLHVRLDLEQGAGPVVVGAYLRPRPALAL